MTVTWRVTKNSFLRGLGIDALSFSVSTTTFWVDGIDRIRPGARTKNRSPGVTTLVMRSLTEKVVDDIFLLGCF